MSSQRREMLKRYGVEERFFVATVQSSNFKTGHMVLTDIYTPGENGKRIKVASHVHVFNVNDPILRKLKSQDMIMFTAVVGNYETTKYDSVIKNYSFNYVDNIKKIGGSR